MSAQGDPVCLSQLGASAPVSGSPTDDSAVSCPQGSGSVVLRKMGTGGSCVSGEGQSQTTHAGNTAEC